MATDPGTHWRSMTDRDFIYAYDLKGRDVTVEVTRVVAGAVPDSNGKKTKKPVLYFNGSNGKENPKPLALNATNAKTIASMYGQFVEAWRGKLITMFPTETDMAGERVQCIRIRPTIPKGKGNPMESAPAQDEANGAG